MNAAAIAASDVATASRLEIGESATVLTILEDLLAVQTAADFKAWSNGALQNALPHAMMMAGIATIEGAQIRMQKMIVDDWPPSYYDAIKKNDGGSPIMLRWRQRYQPQLYDPTVQDDVAKGSWRDAFGDFGLKNIAAHGVRDLSGNHASYFKFAQIPEPLSARHGHLLMLLTPHMHVALSRVLLAPEFHAIAAAPEAQLRLLTQRELVVLYWIGEGKTNWEIAQICNRSQHTIKNQVEHLLRKLQVSNRAQAIHKASRLKIRLAHPTHAD